MIDTIKIFIPHSDIPTGYYDSVFVNFINKRVTKTETNEIWSSATFKNFFLQYTYWGLSIEGSLPKYYYGSNQYTLNQNHFNQAIDQLSIELNLNLKEYRVSRVDLAENIMTLKPVENYYRYFGEAKNLNRLLLNNGIEYRNTNRGIIIYNKAKELKKNNVSLIPLYIGKNIIRIEYRLKNPDSIAKAFGIYKFTVNDLIMNYPTIINLWMTSFNSIYKHNDFITFENETFNQHGMFEKQLMIAGINQIGGGQYVLEVIKEARKDKLFEYPNQATNLLRRMKKLMQSPVLTKKSTLMNEIEAKANMIAVIVSMEQYTWAED